MLSSLLLSLSFYCWYLFCLTAGELALPPLLAAGPGSLFFIGLLPAVLAYAVNSFLLRLERTVLKSLLVNLFFLLLTFLATAWLSRYFGRLFLPGDLPHWIARLLPFIWQLFSWLSGAFFPAAFAAGEGGRPIPIKVLEGSLLLAGPAVFLLAYLSFSASFLAVVIACWFAVMALSLALEGTYLWGDTNPRYDLIFFHLIVPALGGAAFYFAAFTGGFWAFLEGTRSLLAYLGALLFRLLSLIGPMPEVEPLEPEPITFSVEEEVIEAVAEMIPLYITILIVLSVVIGIIALLTFIAWLKTRLQAAPVQRRRKAFSFWKTLKQAWRLLALLMQQLWLGVQHACLSLKHGAVHLSQKLYVFLLRLFPARTPYEKIHRCYQSFLKWGRKLGCRKLPCETPLEYLKRLQASHKKQALALEEAAEMTRLFQEACYSSHPLDWQHARRCQSLLQKITAKSI